MPDDRGAKYLNVVHRAEYCLHAPSIQRIAEVRYSSLEFRHHTRDEVA